MLVLSTVDAHEAFALIELGLKQGHCCLQLLGALSQTIAIRLGLVGSVLVMLLGQLEDLLKLINLCAKLQLEHS